MFGADIGLTTKHVLKIMAEADNNDDGVIEYKECELQKRIEPTHIVMHGPGNQTTTSLFEAVVGQEGARIKTFFLMHFCRRPPAAPALPCANQTTAKVLPVAMEIIQVRFEGSK